MGNEKKEILFFRFPFSTFSFPLFYGFFGVGLGAGFASGSSSSKTLTSERPSR